MNSLVSMRPVSVIALLGTLLGGAGCHGGGDGKKHGDEAAKKDVPVTEVFALGEGALESSLRVPGELIAFERVDMYAKVSSFVEKLYVDVGSEVKQGQLLARLEAPEVLSQLAEGTTRIEAQKAVYVAAKATYDRLLETSKTPGTVSKNDIEQAEARVLSEEARLKGATAAQEALAALRAYLDVRAPFSGVVSARNVSVGAFVGPSGRGSDLPLFTVQQQRLLRLAVSVPEAQVGYIEPGTAVEFTVKARPGKKFTAKVARMAGALDSRLRAERIEMNVENEQLQLLPGMVAEVSVPLASKETRFVIPKTALVNSTTGTFVVRIKDQHAEWQEVQPGRTVGNSVEIYGSLAAGDLLARTATEELRNGSSLPATKVVEAN